AIVAPVFAIPAEVPSERPEGPPRGSQRPAPQSPGNTRPVSHISRRGSSLLPRLASLLPVPLVEHLESVAIARDLPVFPCALQAALQLVHFLLPLPVGRPLIEQVEQRHVDDLAAP